MTITHLLAHYSAYGLWANTRFVERLGRGQDGVLDRPVASSFPSLRATLLHIRDAESAWRCRLIGAPAPWPAEEDRAITSLPRHTAAFHDLVVSLTEEELLVPREYKDLKGDTHRQQAWQMVMHCVNHGTQHRGQLITMMRALGLDTIPANDLVAYQRSLQHAP